MIKVIPILRVFLAQKLVNRGEIYVLVLSSMVPVFMMLIWMRIAETNAIADFLPMKFVAYFSLIFLIGEFVSSTATEEVENDIHSGAIRWVVLKPFNPLMHYFLAELAAATIRIIPLIFLVATIFSLTTASDFINCRFWYVWPLSICLGFALNFFLYFLAGMAGFWSAQASTLDLVLTYLLTLFGGVLAPLSLYPEWMQPVIKWLPFSYIVYFPIKVVFGDIAYDELALGLIYQIALVILLYCLCHEAWRRGVKHHGVFE